ncbi:MAG: site-2 protease family protein [Phycisphaerales bacterium]
MGWEDRNYGLDHSRGRGFRAVLRKVFGDGDNPLDWSIPLYTAWGIRVRLHVVFAFMILAEIISFIPRDGIGLKFRVMSMATLFVLVLLHEYGHCIACRRVRGTADQILMWPLGGLASCAPPHHWLPSLITTLGGPGVNLVLWPVLGAVLLALNQGWGAVVFNPFSPGAVISTLKPALGMSLDVVVLVWWTYYMNAVLFLFNMLLPMYPMDSGRVLHALLWRRMGHDPAMAITVRVGLVVAVALLVIAMPTNNGRLIGLAIFGGITCYLEKRRLAMTSEGMPLPPMPKEEDERDLVRRAAAARKQREKAEREQAELDRLLAKIASQGMASLTRAERAWLDRTSKRKRGE